MSSSSTRHYQGSFRATNAALIIDKPGFRPSSIHFIAPTGLAIGFWTADMGDGAFMYVSATEVDKGTPTVIAAGGAGPTARASGFSLGALANFNDTVNELVYFECWG